MRKFIARVVVVCFIALVAMNATLMAEWQINGNNLNPSGWSHATYPKTCPDGQGGAIVVWLDYSGRICVCAQRIDGGGNLLWADIVPLSTPSDQYNHRIIADGSGGAIVAWEDRRGGNLDVYAQKVNAAGVVQWDPAGVPVCTASGAQSQIVMVSDQRGGAVILWVDERNGNEDLYFTRINASGVCVWGPSDGTRLTDDPLTQAVPVMVSDGAGGFIVAWQDERNGFSDIYGARIRGDGAWAWGGLNGTAICTAGNYQQSPLIASDDAGGAIVAWRDARQGTLDIYAQRMSAGGVPRWAVDGIPIVAIGNDVYTQCAVSDGAGSVYIGFSTYDFLEGAYTIYGQRLTRAGAIQWPAAGFRFSSGLGNQTSLHFTPVGTDGIVAAWSEDRFGTPDTYAQRVDASGTAKWAEDGVSLCNAYNGQYYAEVVTDGAGGAIVAWDDYRNDSYRQVFAQRVTAEGHWGYPAPDIYAVRDIPGDQGGSVNLSWDASRLDPAPEHLIDHYTIWRSISPTAAELLLAEGAKLIEDAGELSVEGARDGASAADLRPGATSRVLRLAEINGEPYYWDLVLTTSAYYLEKYSKVVPTLFDSTSTSAEHHYFQVIAHTDDPYIFYTSEPDSGYSVDNLAPAPPVGLAGEQVYTPEGLNLVWDPNAESDLDCYRIYRGSTEDFVPALSNLLAATPDTTTFDGGWRWSSGYYYKVAAVDIHGNESVYALLRPDNITGVDGAGTPRASFLAQNFPNPFNPTTGIEFALSTRAAVTLRIYDAGGRLVRTLVDRTMPAGKYMRMWDGRTSSGAEAASGIYFYRLDAGTFTATRKMVLLR
jgi:hypothetical protein